AWYLGIKDVSILEIRYQILGSGVMLLSAYLLCRFLTQLSLRDVPIAVVHFGSVILSVTRTQLLVLGAMFAANLFMQPRLFLSRTVIFRLMVLILTAMIIACVGVVSDNVFAERWVERLIDAPTRTGFDITAATRLAEVDFQL